MDSDIFFFSQATGKRTPTSVLVEALRTCVGCDVSEQCLDYAIETRQEFGIWGGYTADDVKRLRRIRQREATTRKAQA